MNQILRRPIWRKAGGLAVLAAALILGLAACYPAGPENLGEIGVVVTFRNPQGDFSNLKTYAMEDVVAELEKPGDDSSEPINPVFIPIILEGLQSQMEAAGFTREPDPETNKPDVWLSVGAVVSEVWVYWYDWGYGGYPGWGWYYPPYVGTASFQQGTIIWQLHDLREVDDPTDPEAKPPLNWVAALNGALRNNPASTEADITSGIKQAFAQSPYVAATGAGK
ncbi:MAG: DUF4136 domain-containing protein [Candidatus Krumholzibacteriota bacterium]